MTSIRLQRLLFSCLVGDNHLLLEKVLVQFAESAVQVEESGPSGADLSCDVLLLFTQPLQLLTLSEHELSLPEQLSIDLLHTHQKTCINALLI